MKSVFVELNITKPSVLLAVSFIVLTSAVSQLGRRSRISKRNLGFQGSYERPPLFFRVYLPTFCKEIDCMVPFGLEPIVEFSMLGIDDPKIEKALDLMNICLEDDSKWKFYGEEIESLLNRAKCDGINCKHLKFFIKTTKDWASHPSDSMLMKLAERSDSVWESLRKKGFSFPLAPYLMLQNISIHLNLYKRLKASDVREDALLTSHLRTALYRSDYLERLIAMKKAYFSHLRDTSSIDRGDKFFLLIKDFLFLKTAAYSEYHSRPIKENIRKSQRELRKIKTLLAQEDKEIREFNTLDRKIAKLSETPPIR